MDSREQTLQPLIGNAEKNLLADDFASGLDDSLLNNREASSLSNQSNYLELASPNAIDKVDNEIQELVFIDSAVTDSQTLIDNISGTAEVIILNDETDGVLQISQSLSQYQNIDAIHLVSHGDAGRLFLGNTQLNADNLEGYTEVLANWDDSLTEEADILLYGCDVAANEEGLAFLNDLSELTRADVLASDDTTGSSILGGDWNLEIALGNVETDIVFNSDVAEAYESALIGTGLNESQLLDYVNNFLDAGLIAFDNPDVILDIDADFINPDDSFFEIGNNGNIIFHIYDINGDLRSIETDFKANDYDFLDNIDLSNVSSIPYGFNFNYYNETNSDLNFANESEAYTHFMEQGWKSNLDPSPFFDVSFYRETNSAFLNPGENPFVHFNTVGWTLGLDPSPFFSTSFYQNKYVDVANSGTNPLEHFLSTGWTVEEQRDPSPSLDNSFYRETYNLDPNVNPLEDYIAQGWQQGRDPSPYFKSDRYLRNYPEVLEAQINPLEDYMTVGWKLGRDPSASFDTDWYLATNPDVRDYRDPNNLPLNPLSHFITQGEPLEKGELRNPSPLVDTEYYYQQNSDVVNAGLGVLQHFQVSGNTEGRLPSLAFESPTQVLIAQSAFSESIPSGGLNNPLDILFPMNWLFIGGAIKLVEGLSELNIESVTQFNFDYSETGTPPFELPDEGTIKVEVFPNGGLIDVLENNIFEFPVDDPVSDYTIHTNPSGTPIFEDIIGGNVLTFPGEEVPIGEYVLSIEPGSPEWVGITNTTDRFIDRECSDCAAQLQDYIESKGISGRRIRLENGIGRGRMFSDSLEKLLTNNGYHEGVVIEVDGVETVFDNFYTRGIPLEQWLDDIFSDPPAELKTVDSW